MTPVLLDSSVIVALLDPGERRHRDCAAALESLAKPLVTCEAVIVESCHLLRRVIGAKEAVLESIATGDFQIPFQLARSAPQIRAILRKYADRQVDLADACLIHLATELRTPDILTLDSDFQVYRWGANKPFHMLISP